MNYKRGLGIGLIFIGAFITLTNATITGNVIGTTPQNYLGLLGIAIFFIGVFLFATGTLEKKTRLETGEPENELDLSTAVAPESTSQSDIARIISGFFNKRDNQSLEHAKKLLRENELYNDANKLNNSEYQKPFLLSYLSKDPIKSEFKGLSKNAVKIIKEDLTERERYHELAHNAANFERLLKQYKFAEAHGVPLDDLDSPKAWHTFYHAYPRGNNPNFSDGLKKTKSSKGFYMCKTRSEAIKALEQLLGHTSRDINIVEVKVSKNIYDKKTGVKPLIKKAPNYDIEGFYIPPNRYKKFNELLEKDLIQIST